MIDATWQRLERLGPEPLSVEAAKLYLRVTHDEEDGLIQELISSARQLVEELTGRSLVAHRWVYHQRAWRAWWWLPRAAPLEAIESAQYWDLADAPHPMVPGVDYVMEPDWPRRLTLRLQPWPPLSQVRAWPIEIVYRTGAADLPALDQAIRLLVAHWYESRELVVSAQARAMEPLPWTVRQLIWPHRVTWRPRGTW